jgi:CheY-like chemotaxis protein
MVNQRILIIEDDVDNVSMMQSLCSLVGADSIVAHDGEEGLHKALSEDYDLILLDMRLPYLSGYDIARAVRNNPHIALKPIIAVTADFESDSRHRALDAGCNFFVGKPINVTKVRELIETLLPIS